jgi:hypothetical protein
MNFRRFAVAGGAFLECLRGADESMQAGIDSPTNSTPSFILVTGFPLSTFHSKLAFPSLFRFFALGIE